MLPLVALVGNTSVEAAERFFSPASVEIPLGLKGAVKHYGLPKGPQSQLAKVRGVPKHHRSSQFETDLVPRERGPQRPLSFSGETRVA